MRESLIVLAPLVALLLGLAIGKAWERYKLHDGRWIDRRRLRETPHYMLGLNYLADNRIDQALEELTRAIGAGNDALEIQLILGNLHRKKGQVGRAINVHEVLLQRGGPDDARARLRAAVPRARLPPRWFRRPRVRSLHRGAAPGPPQPLCADQPPETATRSSTNGPRPCVYGSGSTPTRARAPARSRGSSATPGAKPSSATAISRQRRVRSAMPSTRTPARCPHT